MLELEQVAASAQRLRAATMAANVTMEEFPRDEIGAITSALTRLPGGSAEGCRIPLEYARSRLPAIRREFFVVESQSADDGPNAPFRGLHFDQSLTELIGAVTTALDEYRRLAGEAGDDSILNETTAEAPRSISDLSATSLYTASHLSSANTRIGEIVQETSVRDRLQIQINDATVASELAAAELRMQPIFTRWIRAIGNEIKRAPSRIQKVGRAIQIGVDVAQPLAARWSEFWSNFEKFLFQELREVGVTVENTGKRLEKSIHRKDGTLEHSVDGEFSDWLVNFIRTRQRERTGLSVPDVALGIQFEFRKRPKDYARENGHKRISELIAATPGVFVSETIYGQRAVLEEDRRHYGEALSREMKKFQGLMDQFKSENPVCSPVQLKSWLANRLPKGAPSPTDYLSPAELLATAGYVATARRRWEVKRDRPLEDS